MEIGDFEGKSVILKENPVPGRSYRKPSFLIWMENRPAAAIIGQKRQNSAKNGQKRGSGGPGGLLWASEKTEGNQRNPVILWKCRENQ